MSSGSNEKEAEMAVRDDEILEGESEDESRKVVVGGGIGGLPVDR